MAEELLTSDERAFLLRLARRAIENAVENREMPPVPDTVSERLCQPGVTFVTLTIDGQLRGCIGALEAYQPLVDDVQEHAVAAALSDWRFPPVGKRELARLRIEISRLTAPVPLAYDGPEDLAARLRPGVDGVLMQHRGRRATFLPQVWEKLPSPGAFLSALAEKMGARSDLWRREPVEISIYQVEEFAEE